MLHHLTDVIDFVPAKNPKGIARLADLANSDTLLIGAPESTPISKITKKALTDAGIWEGLQSKGAITTTTTALQIVTAVTGVLCNSGLLHGRKVIWKQVVRKGSMTKTVDDKRGQTPFVIDRFCHNLAARFWPIKHVEGAVVVPCRFRESKHPHLPGIFRGTQ